MMANLNTMGATAPTAGAQLRAAMRHWESGVAVITSGRGEGRIGLVSNSFASLSLDPALVLWSLDRGSSSAAHWSRAEDFAVHFLSEDRPDLLARFARRGAGKFDGIDTTPGLTGAPIVDPLLPRLDCRMWRRIDGGDHIILVGEVRAVHSPEEFRPLRSSALFSATPQTKELS